MKGNRGNGMGLKQAVTRLRGTWSDLKRAHPELEGCWWDDEMKRITAQMMKRVRWEEVRDGE